MKLIAAVLGAATMMTFFAYGDPAVIIRERAKELRDQNNVRQGVDAPVQSAPPSVTPSAPAGPTLSPALLRFNTHVAEIHADATVSTDQKQKLAQDIVFAAQGAKPSVLTAGKLVADVSVAFAEKPLPAASRARFVQELDAVLNPGKYPLAKLDGILRDVQAIFQENGLARIKAVAIAQDVKKLAEEVQKGGA